MAKFKVMATSFDYFDAYVEAENAQEAYEKAVEGRVEWVLVTDHGDFEIHGDLVTEVTDNG